MNLHNAEFIRSVTAVADCPKDGLPQIAFAGKSNVGKSSVINKLLLRKNFARVGEAPGKTTHINFFRIDNKLYLVDLPGYGYAKVPMAEKERWGKLMEKYFAAEDTIDYGVMIVDARHKPTANDVIMADYFKASGKPFVVVANKMDKLKERDRTESGLHPRDADAAGDGRTDPVFGGKRPRPGSASARPPARRRRMSKKAIEMIARSGCAPSGRFSYHRTGEGYVRRQNAGDMRGLLPQEMRFMAGYDAFPCQAAKNMLY